LGQVNYLFTDPNGHRYLFSGDGIFLNSFGRPDLGGKGMPGPRSCTTACSIACRPI
jgi:glyoxylase-like metal-dependent hydrolase (beta-lactamase superfamily II)